MSGSTLLLQLNTYVEVGKERCHLEGTDVQLSPLEGNLFLTCLDTDVATAKVRELGWKRPFPPCQSWPWYALQCALLSPRQVLLRG